MIAETLSYVFRGRPRCGRRQPFLISLVCVKAKILLHHLPLQRPWLQTKSGDKALSKIVDISQYH